MKNTLDSLPVPAVALLETLGVLSYISLFAFLVSSGFLKGIEHQVPEFLAPVFFLTTFVFSALLTGTLVLGYPAMLFFEGNRSRAVAIVVWCLLCFALALLAAFAWFVAWR
ncbi:hypothetical protein KW797_01320 [Candidatus Parcubacteria bacterium]|nr:hypothetical protein [Candidatus Parcubacteria bacterium]